MIGFFLFQSSRPGGRDEPRAAAPPSLCGLLGGARAAVAVGPASWGKKSGAACLLREVVYRCWTRSLHISGRDSIQPEHVTCFDSRLSSVREILS